MCPAVLSVTTGGNEVRGVMGGLVYEGSIVTAIQPAEPASHFSSLGLTRDRGTRLDRWFAGTGTIFSRKQSHYSHILAVKLIAHIVTKSDWTLLCASDHAKRLGNCQKGSEHHDSIIRVRLTEGRLVGFFNIDKTRNLYVFSAIRIIGL